MNILPVMSNAFDISNLWTLTSVEMPFGPPSLYGTIQIAGLDIENPPQGSIVPISFDGHTINALYSTTAFGDKTSLYLAGNIAQNFFTSITINGTILLSADVTVYSYSAGIDSTLWRWSTPVLDGITGSILVVFA